MPKLVDPHQKRAELVAASWAVIAASGLRAATLRRVAEEAGCTTGQLTHYFPDRKALLVAALRAAHSAAGERMANARAREATDRKRLRAVLLEALPLDAERRTEWRVWLAFWAESMNDPDLADEDGRRYSEWRQLLLELVRPCVGSAQEARTQVEYLIALTDGLGLRIARHTGPDAGLEAEQRECRTTLLRFLRRLE